MANEALVRELKFTGVALDKVEADGTFAGYASLFGVTDLAKDQVEKGAIARSLAMRGVTGIRMLFQHDPNEPIGQWLDIREDRRGLFVKGRLAAGVKRADEVLALMREKALDGLSIGFRTVRSRKDAGSGVRHILEADLWEISVVTFPMLPQARVAAVKGAPVLPTIREFELWLRRDAGLSRSEARGVIARGFAKVKREREAAQTTGERLAGRMRAAARNLTHERTNIC